MLVATLSRNRIKDILEIQGKSIYWLAKAINMSYQAVHGLVNSQTIPDGTSYGTLKRISEALNVGIEDLEVESGRPEE